MEDKHVYLSEEDNMSLVSFRTKAFDLHVQGDIKGAQEMGKYALSIINNAMIDALEADIIPDDQSLMYTDLFKSGGHAHMTVDEFKATARTISINTIKDSPLYIDLIALLKKHQEV